MGKLKIGKVAFVGVLLTVVLGLSIGVLFFPGGETREAKSPMIQEVYVWQRVWTEEVHQAVSDRSSQFEAVCLLVAEVDIDPRGQWQVDCFSDPEEYANHHQVVLAVRLGSRTSTSGWDAESCERIVDLLGRYAGICEVFQIDYDCPSGKLADYAGLCARLRSAFPQHQFEVTCLPDWLGREGFESLLGYVDRYVMQVHGLLGYGKGGSLCDSELARDVVRQCGEIGHPFLIALPTYRHAVGIGKQGEILDVVSEGGDLKTGVSYQLRGADPDAMAELVREWNETRPESMLGVIWYRLPVDGESMNWTWETLQQVMHGRSVERRWTKLVARRDDGVYVLLLQNETSGNLELPQTLEIQWKSGYCLAADGVGEFSLSRMNRQSSACLERRAIDPRPIPPGKTVEAAWFRFRNGDVDPVEKMEIMEGWIKPGSP